MKRFLGKNRSPLDEPLKAYVVGYGGSSRRVSEVLCGALREAGVSAVCGAAEPVSDYEAVGLVGSWCSDPSCLGVFVDRPWKTLGPYIVDSLEEHAEATESVDVVVMREGMLKGFNVEHRVVASLDHAKDATTAVVVGGVESAPFVHGLCSMAVRIRVVYPRHTDMSYLQYLMRKACGRKVEMYPFDEEGLVKALGQADLVIVSDRGCANSPLLASALTVLKPYAIVDASQFSESLVARKCKDAGLKVTSSTEYYKIVVREAVLVMLKV